MVEYISAGQGPWHRGMPWTTPHATLPPNSVYPQVNISAKLPPERSTLPSDYSLTHSQDVHYPVTTHSLRTYLASHPSPTPSAAELARQHQIDTKSATRILREFDYTQQLTSEGSGWKYNPSSDKAAKDPLTLLTMSLANGHLLYIPSSLTDSALHKVPLTPYDPEQAKLSEAQQHWNAILNSAPDSMDTVQAMRYLLFGLRLLLESGKLPIRAQITPSGLEPFTL